ncbi:uncharacterized protein LOC134811268 [Bolinopsis microptera]|uniref:uncharacterized protein LOC134811259 n=1 Tax=Bolinopsis microptera TaxID=2820187 RepID=UPI003079AEFA
MSGPRAQLITALSERIKIERVTEFITHSITNNGEQCSCVSCLVQTPVVLGWGIENENILENYENEFPPLIKAELAPKPHNQELWSQVVSNPTLIYGLASSEAPENCHVQRENEYLSDKTTTGVGVLVLKQKNSKCKTTQAQRFKEKEKKQKAYKAKVSKNKHGQCRTESLSFGINLHNGFERLSLREQLCNNSKNEECHSYENRTTGDEAVASKKKPIRKTKAQRNKKKEEKRKAKALQLEIQLLKQFDEIEIIQRSISIEEKEKHEKRTAKRRKKAAKVSLVVNLFKFHNYNYLHDQLLIYDNLVHFEVSYTSFPVRNHQRH